ncbi:hypothetical protein AXW67_35275 [Bradyrhizobium neotropicale]|uniref:Uncharacterized protein n=1 Tax=Bradyrhizobium neotropicale TaxID=1497615 RepID=A0A176ZJ62_9BRAD|nr:hypothetical protein AXW67_35275 [Bradyrhizobium neotropicale]
MSGFYTRGKLQRGYRPRKDELATIKKEAEAELEGRSKNPRMHRQKVTPDQILASDRVLPTSVFGEGLRSVRGERPLLPRGKEQSRLRASTSALIKSCR